jgi:hypothetical protein
MPAAAARKTEPLPEARTRSRTKPRLFYARMLVTRLEEWCVEAETSEEARALFAAGAGHRSAPGESVQIELDHLLDE